METNYDQYLYFFRKCIEKLNMYVRNDGTITIQSESVDMIAEKIFDYISLMNNINFKVIEKLKEMENGYKRTER